MEFYQLKTFYAVATHLNFTKAAVELSISQPAVSRQIEALEHYYQLPLFYRTKKKVELTDAGRHLLKYAIQIVSMADQADKALSSLTDLESGELYVGCGTTIGIYIITDLLIDFKKKYPNIKIQLIIENTSTIIEKLIKNKIDLAIIAKKLDDPRFNYQPLFQDKIHAYSSIEQKEKYEHVQSITELKDEQIFLRERGSHTRECVDSQFKESHFTANNLFELTTNEAIKQAILYNHGIGFLSSTTVRIEQKHQLIFKIPVREISQREFSIISPKGKYTSPIMLIFNSFLTKNMKSIY